MHISVNLQCAALKSFKSRLREGALLNTEAAFAFEGPTLRKA